MRAGYGTGTGLGLLSVWVASNAKKGETDPTSPHGEGPLKSESSSILIARTTPLFFHDDGVYTRYVIVCERDDVSIVHQPKYLLY